MPHSPALPPLPFGSNTACASPLPPGADAAEGSRWYPFCLHQPNMTTCGMLIHSFWGTEHGWLMSPGVLLQGCHSTVCGGRGCCKPFHPAGLSSLLRLLISTPQGDLKEVPLPSKNESRNDSTVLNSSSSDSQSFLKIHRMKRTPPCRKPLRLRVDYVLNKEALGTELQSVDVVFLVGLCLVRNGGQCTKDRAQRRRIKLLDWPGWSHFQSALHGHCWLRVLGLDPGAVECWGTISLPPEAPI